MVRGGRAEPVALDAPSRRSARGGASSAYFGYRRSRAERAAEVRRLATAHVPQPRPLGGRERELLGLTDREAEIALLIAAGGSNQAIADHLCVSINTVKTHTRTLYRKLGVGNRTDMAVWVWSRPERWWEPGPSDQGEGGHHEGDQHHHRAERDGDQVAR
jgi:DNA-binding CsgD family transcriptional regulator